MLFISSQIVFAVSETPASKQTVRFEHLTVSEGLPHIFVFDILQDKLGFMWFATAAGLSKYDGYQFITYASEPEDPSSLSDSFITAIHESRDGNLWIGTTSGGVNRLDLSTDRITRFQHNPEDPDSLAHDSITYGSIYEDESGYLWFGTNGGGLNKLDPKTGRFNRFQHDKNNLSSLSHNSVHAIYPGTPDTITKGLWIGTENGLNQFDPVTGSVIRYQHNKTDSNSLGNDQVRAIYITPEDNTIWIGTKEGLDKFNPADKTFTHYRHDPGNPNSLSHNDIYAIAPAEGNALWISTHGGGLNKFDIDSGSFVSFKNRGDDPYSLNNDTLSMLYQDDTGALWIGTHGSGVNRFDPHNRKFELYQHNPDDPNSLSHSAIFNIFIDQSEIVWLGTFGGLNRFDPKENTFKSYQHDKNDPSSIGSNFVHNVFEDSQGILWVGTWGGGLYQFDRETETFTRFMLEGMVVNRSMYLFEDSKKQLWIGTFEGLYKLNATKTSVTHYQPIPENSNSLSHSIVHAVFEDSQGTIWVSSMGGLNKYQPEQDNFIRYTHDKNNLNSLSNNAVKNIYEDSNNILWLTTDSGLNKFIPKDETFIHYFKRDGLPHNRTDSIIQDDQGIFWIGTPDGLSKFDPVQETFRNYDVLDGLQGNVFNLVAQKDNDGRLYFCGPDGLSVFHPNDITDNHHLPPVRLTELTIFNEKVGIGEGSLLKKHISQTEHITFSHQQSIFGFEFTALNFNIPYKNQYAYKMDGFEKNWNYVDSEQRFARYTNLDPGEYVFRVKASNNDGVWNNDGVSVKITVVPPWWQTRWFQFFAFVFVVGSLLSAVRLRVYSVEQKNRWLKSEVEERTQELTKSVENLEATQKQLVESEKMASLGTLVAGVAHEINTPIGISITAASFVQVEVNKLKNKIKKSSLTRSYLDDFVNSISESSQLLENNLNRAAELVQSFKQVAVDQSSEECYSFDLSENLKQVITSFKYKLRQSYCKVHIDCPEELFIYSYPGSFTQIYSNLILNSLTHGFEKWRGDRDIYIVLQLQDDILYIDYRDTGKGIPSDINGHIFDPFVTSKRGTGGSGLGMYIVYNIVNQLLKGDIHYIASEEGVHFKIQIPHQGSIPI